MRRTELEKIDMLEDKIKSELKQLAEKSEQMQKETSEFSDVSGKQGCTLHSQFSDMSGKQDPLLFLSQDTIR